MRFEQITPNLVKALERAHDPKAHKHPLKIKHMSGDPRKSDRVTYLVTSGQTGTWDYAVSIEFLARGIDVRCGCLAQKHDLWCDHAALALEAAELLTAADVAEATAA